MSQVRVLFVCLGNICRSPQAHGIFEHLARSAGLDDRIAVDSAGTGAWHCGEPPDRRTQLASHRRGIALRHAARQFTVLDFDTFDYILAMDKNNFRDVVALARHDGDRAKVRLLRSHDPSADDLSVPDPYYGDGNGFDRVFQICWDACVPLLAHLCREHGWPPRRDTTPSH